jgi:hypothetical protein
VVAAADARMLGAAQAACEAHGGVALGAQHFDADASCGLSLAEAGVLDFQQRLVLELECASLHGWWRRRATLLGDDSGAPLGVVYLGWSLAQLPSARGTPASVAGDNASAEAARVLFALKARRIGGLSCFGYSGTIAHASLRHAGVGGAAAPVLPPLVCRRRSFPWRDALHPFVQRLILSSNAHRIFQSPAAGALHALVANHVLQGRVVFPGAGYLEVARAAGASTLHGVYFLQPLAAEAPGVLIECAVSNGRFEVRTSETEAFEDATVHCSGATGAGTVWQRVDHASLRTLSRVADVGALYDGFDAVGLQYGPGYRTLINMWGGASDALALLHARSPLEHTQVHPASLDDALCTSAAMASSGGRGTRLPFAVDDALLQSAPGELWAVRSRSHQALSTAPCA